MRRRCDVPLTSRTSRQSTKLAQANNAVRVRPQMLFKKVKTVKVPQVKVKEKEHMTCL